MVSTRNSQQRAMIAESSQNQNQPGVSDETIRVSSSESSGITSNSQLGTTPEPSETADSMPESRLSPMQEAELAVRKRIRALEKLQELQEQEKELRRVLDLESPAPRQRQRRHSSGSSSDDRDIKVTVKNISTFTIRSSFKKREAWLRDL